MKSSIIASSLTNHERAVDSMARLDLAIGYPELTEPQWLLDLLLHPSKEDLRFAYGLRKDFPATATEELHAALIKEVALCLGLAPDQISGAQVIHTGSYALERALLGVLEQGDEILVANPSIDIVSAMLLEQKGIRIKRFRCDSNFNPDINALLDAITPLTKAIVIASPENPTGTVVPSDSIRRVVTAAIDHDLFVVFDQCFVKINPYQINVPLITDFTEPKLKWVLAWDTGKTFGLRGDKLAFIFAAKGVSDKIRVRCNVIRFDVSRRLEILFCKILRTAREQNYFQWISETVRRNIAIIEGFIDSYELPIRIIRPQAGGLLLMDISKVAPPKNDLAFVTDLLQVYGIGLVHGSDFFYEYDDGTRPPGYDHYVRVAVARDTSVIQEMLVALKGLCERWATR